MFTKFRCLFLELERLFSRMEQEQRLQINRNQYSEVHAENEAAVRLTVIIALTEL